MIYSSAGTQAPSPFEPGRLHWQVGPAKLYLSPTTTTEDTMSNDLSTASRSTIGGFTMLDRVIVGVSSSPAWPNRDSLPVGTEAEVVTVDNGDDTVFVRRPAGTPGYSDLGGHWLMARDLTPVVPAVGNDEASLARTYTQAHIDALRSDAAQRVEEARRRFAETRNAEVLAELEARAEYQDITDDALDRILSNLGIERPAVERVVEVTVSTTYRVTIKATSADGRTGMREGDTAYVEQSVHFYDNDFHGDSDIEVVAAEETEGEVTVNTFLD